MMKTTNNVNITSPSFGMALKVNKNVLSDLYKKCNVDQLKQADEFFHSVDTLSRAPINQDLVLAKTNFIPKILGKLMGKPQAKYRFVGTGDIISANLGQITDSSNSQILYSKIADSVKKAQMKEVQIYKMKNSAY